MQSDSESENNLSSSLWDIYNSLETSSELQKAYNDIDPPITKKKGLKNLIEISSKILNYNLSDSYSFFSHETNPNDPVDKIDKTNISYSAFLKRIGNYILGKIYLLENSEKTLKQFIIDSKLQNSDRDYHRNSLLTSFEYIEAKNSEYLDSSLNNETEKEKNTELSQTMKTSQSRFKKRMSENIYITNPLSLSVDSNLGIGNSGKNSLSGSARTEIMQKKSLIKSQTIKENKYWFSDVIKFNIFKFKSFFSENSTETDPKLKTKDLLVVFKKTLEELSINPHPFYQSIFSSITEALHPVKKTQKPNRKPKTQYPKISFDEYVEIMNLWGIKYQENQFKVHGQLISTIKEYEDLIDSEDHGHKLVVESLTSALEKSLNKFIEKHKEQPSVEEKYKKNLENIFDFYAKSQKIQGTEDTFEALETSNFTWNLGIFLKFFSDFHVLHGKTDEKRALTKDQLSVVFKKTASNGRSMSFPQFLESLDKIAGIFFSPELDKLLDTRYAYFPVHEKREMLYKKLGIHDFFELNAKRRTFGSGFGSEKTKKSVTELSKYVFKIKDKDKKELESWKINRKTRDSQMLTSIIAPRDSLRITKRPEINSKIGYSSKLKSKKGSEARDESEESVEKTEKPEKFEKIEKIEKIEKKKVWVDLSDSPPVKKPNIITIKGLSELNFKELIGNDTGFFDMISSEKDEFFDSHYKIDYKLQGILKMHDEKLAKGKKVVERNKYSKFS